MITVLVCCKITGHPVRNARVALGKDGFLTGGVTRGEWTDSRGEAYFDTSNGRGCVYVNGHVRYTGSLGGRHVIYV
jgi:hypothetical protein